MTVFKTFWNIVKKYKGTVILYTVILIAFSAANMTTSDTNINFVNTKPNIFIVNQDSDNTVTNNLIKYMESNCNVVDIKKENIDDAVFYRDVSYVIYIPKNYGEDVFKNLNPEIDIKANGDYGSSLAEMMLTRYIKAQNIYNKTTDDMDNLVQLINDNLSDTSKVEVISKLDIEKVKNVSFFFSFASYSVMAVIIYIVCLVMSSFNEKRINKRTVVSSMHYKKHNKFVLLGSLVYTVIIWLFYTVLAVFIVGDVIFTMRGLVYVLNLLLFSICSLTIALFISTLINNKEAVSGIVNVVALGSAFLCGAFLPAEWLPDGVLKFAHILPSYWYINSNDLLATIEVVNLRSLGKIGINSLVLIGFSILFIILNNIVTRKKLKFD